MTELGGERIGGAAEEIGDVALESFGCGLLVRLQAGLIDTEGEKAALTFIRFFGWTSHSSSSLPWHGRDFEVRGRIGQRTPGGPLTYAIK